MPINYKKYPAFWKIIRAKILARAENKCELCGAENYKPHWKTGSKVVLTVAHIDQDINNNEDWNLLALCQRCHLRIDLPYKIKKRKKEVDKMKIYRNKLYSIEDAAKRSGIEKNQLETLISVDAVEYEKQFGIKYIRGEEIPKIKNKWDFFNRPGIMPDPKPIKNTKVTMLRMDKGD